MGVSKENGGRGREQAGHGGGSRPMVGERGVRQAIRLTGVGLAPHPLLLSSLPPTYAKVQGSDEDEVPSAPL